MGEVEEFLRVLRLAIDQHLVMHMRAGAAAGAAEEPDPLVRRHLLPDRDGGPMEMGIEGFDAVAVVDLHRLAVIAAIAGEGDLSGGRGVDRRQIGRVEIEAGVDRGAMVERVAP
jgi:hypothetical protein